MKVLCSTFKLSAQFCKNTDDFFAYGLTSTPVEIDELSTVNIRINNNNIYQKLYFSLSQHGKIKRKYRFQELIEFHPVKKHWFSSKGEYRYRQIYLLYSNDGSV